MKKILLTGFVLLFTFISLNLISAGLCRGNDGYYHDCKEHYYRNGERVYDSEFYYDKENDSRLDYRDDVFYFYVKG